MRGWLFSLVAHLVFVFAGYLIWPHVTKTLGEEGAIVPVDIVTFADKSNITPLSAPDALPAPTATEQGAPQDTTEATPPPEAIAEPIDKPKPKIPDKPKPQQFSLDNLSALIDRSKKKAGNNSNATAPTAPPGTKPREGFGAQNAMTATIKDYLAAKIGVCWRDVKDMPNPERLIVTVHVTLGRDGNLTTQPRVTSFVAPGDTYMRVAADNAARAVRLCGPYELPQDSYSVWRELDLKFGPKGLQ